jgi:chromosomal replication initiation ATPase DnaA
MTLTLEQRVEILEQKAMERTPSAKRTLAQIMELFPEGYAIATECKKATCRESDLPMKSMRWTGRTKHLARWRQVAMFLAFELSGLSSQDVATIFNRKDHATVLYAHKMVPKRTRPEVLRRLREQVVPKQNAA